jgi:two-component system, OmpR family, sensor kinase
MTAAEDTITSEPEPPAPLRGVRRVRPGALRRLSQRTPLRVKLITAVLALVIMALAAISVASVVMLRSYVETRQDSALQSAFSQYANQPTRDGEANVPSYGRPGESQPIVPGYAYSYAELIFALQEPGRQISLYPNFTGPGSSGQAATSQAALPSLPTGADWASAPSGALISVAARSGPDTWRVIAETQTYPVVNTTTNAVTNEKLTLVIGVDLGNLSAMTTRLVLFDLIVGGAIVVVLAVVAIGLVRTNLRPLDDIELTAGQIAAGHLYHRVPEGDPRTEVGSLGRSLNAMLAQIETAFGKQQQSERAAHESEERMRRFVADASHELRTPLTTIRGFAAHYRQRGGVSAAPPAKTESASQTGAGSPAPATSSSGGGGLSAAEVNHLMSRVEAEATRMGLLVEDLLTLARLDQQRPVTKAPVDLLTVAVDAVQDARIVSPGRPIDLVVAPGTAFLVEGDEPRLRQVLANLVNNALTHTPAGTPVRVKISRGSLGPDGAADEAPAVVLDVEDDGPGMTADQAKRVFERFYRADAARNRASGGTGLGLAIVAGLVNAHGGTVSVRTEPGQGADFQVKLPLSPDVLGFEDPDDEPLA